MNITSQFAFIWENDMLSVVGVKVNGKVMSPDKVHNTATFQDCLDIIKSNPNYDVYLPKKFKTPEFALAAKLS